MLYMRCVREDRFLTLLKGSASLVAQSKNPSAMQETWVQFQVGRSPGEGNGNSLQYSCLGNPMNKEDWRATFHGVTKQSDMT